MLDWCECAVKVQPRAWRRLAGRGLRTAFAMRMLGESSRVCFSVWMMLCLSACCTGELPSVGTDKAGGGRDRPGPTRGAVGSADLMTSRDPRVSRPRGSAGQSRRGHCPPSSVTIGNRGCPRAIEHPDSAFMTRAASASGQDTPSIQPVTMALSARSPVPSRTGQHPHTRRDATRPRCPLKTRRYAGSAIGLAASLARRSEPIPGDSAFLHRRSVSAHLALSASTSSERGRDASRWTSAAVRSGAQRDTDALMSK